MKYIANITYHNLSQQNINKMWPWKTSNHAQHRTPTIDLQTKIISFKLKNNMLWTSCQNFN